MTAYHKVLIANRGEIAERVIRSARALGYRTVAVYSEADSHARHVTEADEAVCIGPAPVGQSYLRAESIIEAARLTGADAVHPGYGFLSENADFAEACQHAGITFIGPPAEAIRLMGSKRLSKIAMLEAGVPCVPGYEGDDQSEDNLIARGIEIGFPLMVKASAGGGGRGMRLVWDEAELPAMLRTARSEAQSAFGDGELILEKAIIKPRHIEIQVFADQMGNTVYLGERDCSIQRRHQKVVEEAPSPFLSEELRQAMGKAAVDATRACNYVGAGTVEFLVDASGHFYFLEMNTRLQVEHPVTELITGTDLVAWQLQVAAGEVLPLSQQEIQLNGHAIEVRLYAEDPSQNFMPQTGKVLRWQPTSGEGVRVDHGLQQGQEISAHYDPMLAKVIAWGRNREEARRRLIRAVEDNLLLGINSNREFLANILRHPTFAAGEATTAFIEQQFSNDPSLQAPETSLEELALATVLFYIHSGSKRAHTPELLSWRNSNPSPWPYRLGCGDKLHEIQLSIEDHGTAPRYRICLGQAEHEIEVLEICTENCIYVSQGVRSNIRYLLDEQQLYLDSPQGNSYFENMTHAPAASADQAGSGELLASMDGVIVDVLIQEGDMVQQDQTLMVMEAMKMEHQLKAGISGVISQIQVTSGDQVKGRQLLLTISDSEIL